MRKATSQYQDRITTSLLCSKSLKDRAINEGIVLSSTLEEALEAKLLTPKTEEDLEKERTELTLRLEALEQKEEALAVEKRNKIVNAEKAQRKKDRDYVKSRFSPGDEHFSKLVRKFGEKYNIDYSEAYKEVMK